MVIHTSIHHLRIHLKCSNIWWMLMFMITDLISIRILFRIKERPY
nr:MAG TPA: hypothetical protein [Caudoviricetes sp.]